MSEDPARNHEYLPIAGLAEYLSASQTLLLGEGSPALEKQRVVSVQTLSGTGALHLGSLFLSRFFKESPAKQVYLSDPAYVNHLPILQHVGLRTDDYPYYIPTTRSLNLDGMIAKLVSIPTGSIVLLQACAHNPTGIDPNREQWKQIAATMKARNLLPFFDSAYQGFASGDLDDDAWSVRYFIEQEFEIIMIAQSYAKNFGLYGERVGCLHLVAPSPALAKNSFDQLKRLHRVINSTPPAYGARIVSLVLNDEALFEQWVGDLQTMSGRIKEMRQTLRRYLEDDETPGTWSHITDQVGMFCFTGLTQPQVRELREKHHIYMTNEGRISVAGLNQGNVKAVAEAFKTVTRHLQ